MNEIINNITELYVMKAHTTFCYNACALATKGYSESLFTLFCRTSDQDRHHAAMLYGHLLTLTDEPAAPVAAVLPAFSALCAGNDDGDRAEATVGNALACLHDAARAERIFARRAEEIGQTEQIGGFDGESLQGFVMVSQKRMFEFTELFEQVKEDRFHGQNAAHDCAYCGLRLPAQTDECPTCKQPFPFQERVGGYLGKIQ